MVFCICLVCFVSCCARSELKCIATYFLIVLFAIFRQYIQKKREQEGTSVDAVNDVAGTLTSSESDSDVDDALHESPMDRRERHYQATRRRIHHH